MMRVLFGCVIILLGGMPLPAEVAGDTASGTAIDQAVLEPFLKKYCLRCHGPRKQRGQVRFDEVDWTVADNDSAQRWQDVLDQLNGGDMPPEDFKQPSFGELSAVLDSLTGSVNTARRRLTDHGGEIKMRRLNRREYANTIRDLFGFKLELDEIPEDGEVVTFDTVGEEQFFTSTHFERYFELGKRISALALEYNTKPYQPASSERSEPEERVTKKMREDLAKHDRMKLLREEGKSWQELGFKDEGEMEILFRQWETRVELPRQYLRYPHVESGIYISDVAKWATAVRHADPRADYIVRVHGAVLGQPHPLRRILRLYDTERIHGTLTMRGTPENPETVSLRVRQPIGSKRLLVRARENQPDHTINTMRNYLPKLGQPGKVREPRAALWIDWMEIEGPFYSEERPRFESLLFDEQETGVVRSDLLAGQRESRRFIEEFTELAFRGQKPVPAFLDGLHDRYLALRGEEVTHQVALAEIMGIVLSSPSFLFIQEAAPAQVVSHGRLENHELANRLSYFLWSAPPDERLLAANLREETVYTQEVERLLSDPRAQALRDGFVSQWAEFDRFDAITVDRKKHYRFNEGVQEDAKREVLEYFGYVLEKNLSVSSLVDSDFTMLNGALAAHYEIPFNTPRDGSFRKVNLPADSPRGGLFTQAAFLTTGSNGERSSPVIRGALILEKVLHDKPAPPPPNVPELDSASEEPITNREMVLLHQNRPTCASCHQEMDVIGFGLENFDTVGRWRTSEKLGKREVAIEPGGILPDGSQFAGVRELKQLLFAQESRLAEELVESLLSYGLGRTIEFSDQDDIAKILQAVGGDGYRLRDIVSAVAHSPLFRQKG